MCYNKRGDVTPFLFEMKTPIRYAGGKSKSLQNYHRHMAQDAPWHVSCPFMGGGSLESRWSSELGIDVVHMMYLMLWLTSGLYCWHHHRSWQISVLSSPDKETYDDIKEQLMCWDYTQDMLKDWQAQIITREPRHNLII